MQEVAALKGKFIRTLQDGRRVRAEILIAHACVIMEDSNQCYGVFAVLKSETGRITAQTLRDFVILNDETTTPGEP